MPRVRVAAASVFAALVVCAAAFAAGGENPQYKPNAADITAARAASLRASDVGTVKNSPPPMAGGDHPEAWLRVDRRQQSLIAIIKELGEQIAKA